MRKRNRKSIIPPDDMPRKFQLHNRTYTWYPTLNRAKKRYLIKVFTSNRQFVEIIDSKLVKLTNRHIIARSKIEGILVWKWDTWAGPKAFWNFPSENLPDANTLMQSYMMHKAIGTTGMISMEAKGKSFISYFADSEAKIFCLLTAQQGLDPLPLEPLLEKFWTDLVSQGPLEEDNMIAKDKLKYFFQKLKGGIPSGTN
jgi:hypothetical protein